LSRQLARRQRIRNRESRADDASGLEKFAAVRAEALRLVGLIVHVEFSQ
jgi:hypothetical protein